MSSENTRTVDVAKGTMRTLRNNLKMADKIQYYNQWAQTYEQDLALLEYRAPSLVAAQVSAHFSGERRAAAVLDVACGTGLAAKMMKQEGFERFVGVDCSEGMLQHARQTGLYQDLKMAVVGDQPLPVPLGDFDVVTLVGGLSSTHIPVKVIRELCQAAKQGGLICMTTRANHDNAIFKVALEAEMKQMEEEGLWRRVEVADVSEFQYNVTDNEDGYNPGCVYLFQRL
ncbi:methyltransferase-like protein 27 isoform X2 [Festucalex cinctus]